MGVFTCPSSPSLGPCAASLERRGRAALDLDPDVALGTVYALPLAPLARTLSVDHLSPLPVCPRNPMHPAPALRAPLSSRPVASHLSVSLPPCYLFCWISLHPSSLNRYFTQHSIYVDLYLSTGPSSRSPLLSPLSLSISISPTFSRSRNRLAGTCCLITFFYLSCPVVYTNPLPPRRPQRSPSRSAPPLNDEDTVVAYGRDKT